LAEELAAAVGVVESALGTVFPAAALEIWQHHDCVFSRTFGWIDPDARRVPVSAATRFDLASLTKLFTTIAFLRLARDGRVRLDDRVSLVLPRFAGLRELQPYEDPLHPGILISVPFTGSAPKSVDAGTVTFRQLLAHTSGLPAWRPLFRSGGVEPAREMLFGTFFSYPPDARVLYSDLGFMLLGEAVIALTGQQLPEAFGRLVFRPFGLRATGFLPDATQVAPTEICGWRQRRLIGEVDDENCAVLGGVAGHAGLFAPVGDLARFGEHLLTVQDGEAGSWADQLGREQAAEGPLRRGLGTLLWSPDPDSFGHPFHPGSFGHTGFTGSSLWVDPVNQVVVALCTNRVYYGRDRTGIAELRVALHRAVAAGLGIPPVLRSSLYE
jgi:serine-type D-Ala-D-Ala carboxypeptidase